MQEVGRKVLSVLHAVHFHSESGILPVSPSYSVYEKMMNTNIYGNEDSILY